MLVKMMNGAWTGNRCLFGDLEFWPERGMIRILERDTGELTTISVREALNRLLALVQSAGRDKFPEDRQRMLNFADDMTKCCKIARSQGDPFDPNIKLHGMPSRGKQIYLPNIKAGSKEYFCGPTIN